MRAAACQGGYVCPHADPGASAPDFEDGDSGPDPHGEYIGYAGNIGPPAGGGAWGVRGVI